MTIYLHANMKDNILWPNPQAGFKQLLSPGGNRRRTIKPKNQQKLLIKADTKTTED